MTENHDLHTPEKGTRNWHNPLNANFTKLDNKVEIRGKSAERSNYTPAAGVKYFSTDTGNIYLGDGDGWKELPSSGQTPSFNSVSTDRINDVQIANERQTIQEAHDALPSFADGGRIVVTPSYDAGDSLPIRITKPVVISGQGWGQNQGVVYSGNTTDTVFELELEQNYGRAAMIFQNLRVVGGKIGVEILDANRTAFRDCLFHGQDQNNVNFVADGFTGWVLFDHCWMHSAGDVGLDMRVPSGNTEPNATWINNTSVGDAGAQGICLNGLGTVMNGGSVEGCASEGIRAEGATNASTINGVYFEQNAQSGGEDANIYVTGAYGTQIKNTFHTDAGTPASNAILEQDGYYTNIDGVYGPNAAVNLRYSTDPSVRGVTPQGTITVNSGVTRPRVNGLGRARGNAEEPTPSNWQMGELVEWTDTGGGSGDGIYLLNHLGSWNKIA